MKCQNPECNNETDNPRFCSRSCSAICTNKESTKKKLTNECKECGVLIKSNRMYCKIHKSFGHYKYGENPTLGDVLYISGKPSDMYNFVRERARSLIRKLGIISCQKCGYYKHIEVCHIKPISEFSLDTLISIINDITNLIILCPNCHWEFDNS